MTNRIDRLTELSFNAGTVFSPSAPIDQKSLFAGRIEQLQKMIDAIGTKGRHVVLYGERGVGKTSLASIVSQLFAPAKGPSSIMTVRENCHSNDTYGRLWRRAFEQVSFEVKRPRIGFNAEDATDIASIASMIPEDPRPDEVVLALRRIRSHLVFIFDEFDQILDKNVTVQFAETIKALSDHAVPTTVVVVGVGDNVDSLIASHASIERALVQIPLHRMKTDELSEIITKAMKTLKMTCDPEAQSRIVRLSQGLPHYVHLLGLDSTRAALLRGSTSVVLSDVDSGVKTALSNVAQSVLDAYLKAVSSPQKVTLFRDVLLACALAPTDELGFFSPAAVREPLKAIGRELDIPAFASHLNKFSSPGRGEILQKVGQSRRYRYRFKNPLLQPYVVLRGVADSVLTFKEAERLLSARASKR